MTWMITIISVVAVIVIINMISVIATIRALWVPGLAASWRRRGLP